MHVELLDYMGDDLAATKVFGFWMTIPLEREAVTAELSCLDEPQMAKVMVTVQE